MRVRLTADTLTRHFLMYFPAALILELASLGLIGGFLAGLLGIGGGMIMVPFMAIILSGYGADPALAIKMAIATSMATIVFTSLSSVRAHHKRGAVRWDLVRGIAPGIVLGAAIASMGVFAMLRGSTLALIFALFVGFSATQMFLDKKPAPHRQIPGMLGLGSAGSGHRFCIWPGWCGWRLHQRTVHGLVQCCHP